MTTNKKLWWKIILIFPGVLIFISVFTYFVFVKNKSATLYTADNKTTCSGDFAGKAPARDSASGAFTSPITDIDSISRITPGKYMFDPRFVYLGIKDQKRIPVYAPADGTLIRIFYKISETRGDYDLVFLVDCHTTYRINHITDPNPNIAALTPITEPMPIGPNGIIGLTNDKITPKENIRVKAGEQLGTTTGTEQAHNWDFSVYIDRQSVCPFEQYSEPLRSAWLAKLGDKNQLVAGLKCEVSGTD